MLNHSMSSDQTGQWDPGPRSKHGSAFQKPKQTSSTLQQYTHVTAATPAKWITFYKSGNSQFGGIRMAVHKRSFKCFDALLDDLTQKVPLPYGVRTITTPRGTNSITHLEQLQDGGCYLCSDHRQAKPIKIEQANKHQGKWYHHNRRPHRPDTSSEKPSGHLPHRQRQILLVKNSEPGIRKSIVLSRRSMRSIRTFLEEASELMQFNIRKLYTADGRKVDSVQSLMSCPGVLMCIGREPFSPMLVNILKKSSKEKLPSLDRKSPCLGPRTPGNEVRSPVTQGLRSPPHVSPQSRTSEYSEGHESKKNLNFGLETKKSIIHPRSDSSNRSTRFSLSSEKSNGVGPYSQSRPAIMNDDIEKRVVVNKDGSLSVEMKVRFRLRNDETLQWSTQIKKSPSLTNGCCSLEQVQSHFLQKNQSESCSEPESMTFDPEGTDFSNPVRRTFDANHCPCCYQLSEQSYDMWENPAHSPKQPQAAPSSDHIQTSTRQSNSASSSSSCNSRRVVHCQAKISNCNGISRSECSQLIQEQMCVTERKVEVDQDGETHIKVHRVRRCHSRSEVVTVDGKPQQQQNISDERELMMEEECPISSVSSSSRVLQSLKEDQDDEDDVVPPSISQCCQSKEPTPAPTSRSCLSNDPSSNHSEKGTTTSATPSCCCKAVTQDQTPSSRSNISTVPCMSNKDKVLNPGEEKATKEEETMVVNGLFRHSGEPHKSETSSVCSKCGGCQCGTGLVSQGSQHSQQVTSNPPSTACMEDESGSDDSSVSMQSNKTNLTKSERISALSNVKWDGPSSAMSTSSKSEPAAEEERRKEMKEEENGEVSASSKESLHEEPISTYAKSRTSHKFNCSSIAKGVDIISTEVADGENTAERDNSVTSAKTNVSSPNADFTVEGKRNQITPSQLSDQAVSAKSAGSPVTEKSKTSHNSACSHSKLGSSGSEGHQNTETAEGEGTEKGMRSVSSLSTKSNLSIKSHKSCKSIKVSKQSLSPEPGREREDRTISQMSVTEEAQDKGNGIFFSEQENRERLGSARSGGSKASNRSHSRCSDKMENGETKDGTASESSLKSTRDVDGGMERTTSAMSSKSTKSRRLASPPREENQTTNQHQIVSSMCVCVDDEGNKEDVVASSTNHKEKPQTPRAAETRGTSALSVHSKASSKSGKSKCQCRVTVETPKVKKDMGEEDDKASGKASSLSKSVSLGLPEDQDTGESESYMSFHSGTKSKKQIKMENLDFSKSPEVSSSNKDFDGTKSTMSDNPFSVGIPTIKTPGLGKDEEPSPKISRAASAASAKSSRSRRSSCKCGSIKTKCVANNLDAPNNRASPLMSTAGPKVQDTSAVVDSANQSRLADEAACHQTSQRPESVGSSKSRSNAKEISEGLHSEKSDKERSDSGKTTNSQKREKTDCCLHSSRQISKCDTSSDTALSQTLSAADLLKETRPHNQQSETKTGNGRSVKSRRVKTPNVQQELSPSCLPNASPTEVVNEWLQRIPDESNMLGLGDELEEGEHKEFKKTSENEDNSTEGNMLEIEENVGAKTGDKGEITEEEQRTATSPNAVPQNGLETSCSKVPARNWQSSATVMKVLLNSSMGRCHSMPEISPVYGRRLSTSAKGLLDCLAQLQLIQPAVDHGPDQEKKPNQQYEGVIAILQSLWLNEPSNIDQKLVKDNGPMQVTPPRSSSGVDMQSGSGGSGKDELNKGRDETSVKEVEPLHEDNEAENMLEDVEIAKAEGQLDSEEQSTIPSSLDSPKATENSSSPDKSSANDSSKSPTDNERETVDDTSSGTPPTVLHGSLSRRQSQDPDPVWVLNLLRKLEKQFINHYVNAMAEFKVRWDLDDNLILNTMISELREEVSSRIQSSISQEIKKIQGRAGKVGRTPRPPPRANLSRESTMTEKRRKMLKVMKNQSVKTADSQSDGETTGEFSDQRSEDEYCPCDACVRKKIAARPLKTNPAAAEAPVMMEFDLLKILQLKKSPIPSPAPLAAEKEGAKQSTEGEVRSLEVLQEEDEDEEEEVSKEDIKAKLILEEAISEKDEEEEEDEEDKGVTGNTKIVNKSGGSDEEQEEKTGEKEDVMVNGEEEEDEEEEGVRESEDRDELGDEEEHGEGKEDGENAANGEEESDKGTVKEMTADVLNYINDREEEEDGEGKKDEEGEDEEEVNGKVEENDDAAKPGEDQEESPEGMEAEGREEVSSQEQEKTNTYVDNDEKEEENGREAEEDEGKDDKKQDLLHQFTRTSVESQPGSLEDIP